MDRCIENGLLWRTYKSRSYGLINSYVQRKQINRTDKRMLCDLLCITGDYPDNMVEPAIINYKAFCAVADKLRNSERGTDFNSIELKAVRKAFIKHSIK